MTTEHAQQSQGRSGHTRRRFLAATGGAAELAERAHAVTVRTGRTGSWTRR
ncbi:MULTISPECIES: hypothetical protein [unclassified Streptomyces]|uniref:hypothetical protein n=1 Tax=unclassified Streptomyces TaxID=2593676 RepID=UPI0033A52D31